MSSNLYHLVSSKKDKFVFATVTTLNLIRGSTCNFPLKNN
jgi:hypothetical protein